MSHLVMGRLMGTHRVAQLKIDSNGSMFDIGKIYITRTS